MAGWILNCWPTWHSSRLASKAGRKDTSIYKNNLSWNFGFSFVLSLEEAVIRMAGAVSRLKSTMNEQVVSFCLLGVLFWMPHIYAFLICRIWPSSECTKQSNLFLLPVTDYTPLKNDGLRQLGWWHSIPNCFWKVNPNSMVPVTTNQLWLMVTVRLYLGMLPYGKWAIYGWVTQIILWKMVIFHGSNRLTSRSWSFGQIFWGGFLRILWKYQTVSNEYYIIRVHWF